MVRKNRLLSAGVGLFLVSRYRGGGGEIRKLFQKKKKNGIKMWNRPQQHESNGRTKRYRPTVPFRVTDDEIRFWIATGRGVPTASPGSVLRELNEIRSTPDDVPIVSGARPSQAGGRHVRTYVTYTLTTGPNNRYFLVCVYAFSEPIYHLKTIESLASHQYNT